MKTIGTLLLMILTLSGCNSIERKAICKEIKKNEIIPLEKCMISFKFQKCRCRIFNMNTWETIGEAYDQPLEYCDGISGYKAIDEAVEIRPKVKALSRLKENLCQPKQTKNSKSLNKNITTPRAQEEGRSYLR
jgi:hypothetical protein